MKSTWIKFASLGAIAVLLLWALGSMHNLVEERRARRAEAETGVAASLAGAQSLLGPALQRECRETWKKTEGDGKDRKLSIEQRTFRQTLWPHRLDITTTITLERYARGLFTVNGYVGVSTLVADWQDTTAPTPDATLVDSVVHCDAPTLAVFTADPRGIRAAHITVDDRELTLRSVRGAKAIRVGIEGVVPDDAAHGNALHAKVALTTVGTGSIAWVPVGDETLVHVVADWPHPAFAGDFLPITRAVDARGFDARWQVSGLATSARQALDDGGAACPLDDDSATKRGRAERFGVRFIDPVDGYVLTDRAIKYGVRPGFAFGAAITMLYAVLHALLQLEQTALLLGSLLLFAVLAVVMLVTRRFDWYALLARV